MSGGEGIPAVGLFLILAVSLAFLSTFLGYRRLKERFASDLHAFLAYFACFFVLLFAAPAAWVLAVGRASGLTLASVGLCLGNWRIGLPALLVAAPLVAITLLNSARDPVIRAWYPFSKEATRSAGRLFLYEAAYVCLYYLAWDFAFRGLLQATLARLLSAGLPGFTAAAVAILVQTALSTIFHLGHPDSEIWGAFAVGIIFGAITAATGSMLYSFAIHAIVGVSNDLYITRRGRGGATR